MEFTKEKSHLSDLKKIEFESNTTSKSSILEIPGIGAKTKEVMETKDIFTIDDLIKSIDNDFKKLNLLTPAKVNNHTIFDALEIYRETADTKITDRNPPYYTYEIIRRDKDIDYIRNDQESRTVFASQIKKSEQSGKWVLDERVLAIPAEITNGGNIEEILKIQKKCTIQ